MLLARRRLPREGLQLGFAAVDPAGFHAILDFREGKRAERDIDVEATLNQYFAFVDAVTDKFDRQLDARK